MSRTRAFVASAAGLTVLLAAWETAGRSGAAGSAVVPPSTVAAYAAMPEHARVLSAALADTAREAFAGFLAGACAAYAVAALAALVPVLAPGFERFAAVVNGVPILAVGSICAVTFPAGDNPVIVAALGTFFIVFVAANAGFATDSGVRRDVLRAFGASATTMFFRLRVPAALPAVVAGLRAAAPLAVVGAVIGEWFGSERGLGPVLVNAMQNYQIPLLWATAVACTALSSVAYLALGFLARHARERYA